MPKRRTVFIVDLILLAVLPMCAAFAPWLMAVLPDCPVTKLGLLCPACGGTRCVLFLSDGNLIGAFRMHPYLFLTVVLGALLLIWLNAAVFFVQRKENKLLSRILRPSSIVIWAIGYGLYGILRNVL